MLVFPTVEDEPDFEVPDSQRLHVLLIENSKQITGAFKAALFLAEMLGHQFDFEFVIPANSRLADVVEIKGNSLPSIAHGRNQSILSWIGRLHSYTGIQYPPPSSASRAKKNRRRDHQRLLQLAWRSIESNGVGRARYHDRSLAPKESVHSAKLGVVAAGRTLLPCCCRSFQSCEVSIAVKGEYSRGI